MDREEIIRQRAYRIWEEEGRPEGRDRLHWDQAAREVDGDPAEANTGTDETRRNSHSPDGDSASPPSAVPETQSAGRAARR
jgi:hypothetical protein